MPQSLTDTINLIASVVSIIGGVISIGGAAYVSKWQARSGAAAITQRKPQQAPTGPWRPSAPPSRRPATYPPAKAPERGVSHPIIFSFSALGLLAVIIYSAESLVNYTQSRGTSAGVPLNSPLVGVNAVLIVVNLACVTIVTVGMAVAAYRTRNWAWLTTGVIALVVSLCTIGIFSVVAFAPGVFYGLSNPREPDMWGS